MIIVIIIFKKEEKERLGRQGQRDNPTEMIK